MDATASLYQADDVVPSDSLTDASEIPARIVQYPDPRLRRRSEEVCRFNNELHGLIAKLSTTLVQSTGIGLSAPQIGHKQRVLVVRKEDHSPDVQSSSVDVYINPRITQKAGFAFVSESCLSLPGIQASVVRSVQITVSAQDATGAWFVRELEGMPAVCLQHELDHLDGVLFIDHVSALRSWRFKKVLRSLERQQA